MGDRLGDIDDITQNSPGLMPTSLNSHEIVTHPAVRGMSLNFPEWPPKNALLAALYVRMRALRVVIFSACAHFFMYLCFLAAFW